MFSILRQIYWHIILAVYLAIFCCDPHLIELYRVHIYENIAVQNEAIALRTFDIWLIRYSSAV